MSHRLELTQHTRCVMSTVCSNELINYTILVTKMQVKKNRLSIKSVEQSIRLPPPENDDKTDADHKGETDNPFTEFWLFADPCPRQIEG